MATKPMSIDPLSHPTEQTRESGFVLLTVMIMLALFSLLGVSQLFRSITIQQESGASSKSMQASYYAETAISYLQWAWANDADFDDGSGGGGAGNQQKGDREEWLTAITNPTSVISYWDNGTDNSSAPTNRALLWSSASCLPLSSSSPSYCSPTLSAVSTDISSRANYIKLEISQLDGTITPTLVTDGSTPTNGAIVWVTAGSETQDYHVDNIACTPPATD
ncbi:MAG: hypothetical protein Q9M13_04755, partial [Mariprofundales bacterium]|nr:hypothetical protein [Mariprofundales bacterium]